MRRQHKAHGTVGKEWLVHTQIHVTYVSAVGSDYTDSAEDNLCPILHSHILLPLRCGDVAIGHLVT